MADLHYILLFLVTIFLTEPIPATTQAPVPSTPCPRDTSFRCSNGQCVPNFARCNRYFECDDRSDEIGCPVPEPCTVYETACRDGTCIDSRYFCDSRPDCPDGSDELNCGKCCCFLLITKKLYFVLSGEM